MKLSFSAILPVRLRIAIMLPGLICVSAESAFADDWPGPLIREVFSPSRNFKVRVVPGESYGDQVGYGGSRKGPYATAQLCQKAGTDRYTPLRTFTLLNPVAPVDVFLTDRGHVITFDNWHNMGYGKVAVLYGTNGLVVRAYSLQDLFSAHEMRLFLRSASSVWWRTGLGTGEATRPKLAKGQRSIRIATKIKGRNVDFDLETGAYTKREGQGCVALR